MSRQINRSKDHIKISVLMPIYNASTYLRQSLDSVTGQTLADIEIICINDGSTDNSLEIIREYAEKDSRIVIIDKPNSGYGDSMNHGLDIAKGKYIAILEPDDWYETSMLKTLYDLATQNNLDVIKCDFYQYSNQTRQNKQYHLFKPSQCDKVISNDEDNFIYSLQPSIWSAIYKQNFLNKNNIRFLDTPGASYQDTSFNFKVFALARRVMFINMPLIHYRIDNNQSSINNIAKKLPNIDKEYDEIDRFIIGHRLSNKLGETAVACRYRTYLWAMEQLPNNEIIRFCLIASRKLKESGKKMKISDKKLPKQCVQLMNQRRLYTIKRLIRLNIHRIKFKLVMKKQP